jgi:hypothetical protein
LLIPIPDRFILQYANTNRELQLAYPTALFNDVTPPQINDVAANFGIITWITDEFADSEVIYGESAGQYTQSVQDPLYVKQHEITLTGLTAGTTYYYKVRSADRSGNTFESVEYSFTDFTALISVGVVGPLTGTVDTAYHFSATIQPPMATLPITYTWSPTPLGGQDTAVTTYTWTMTGVKSITVTAMNIGSLVTGTHVIIISSEPAKFDIYLPLVLRND